MSVSRRRLLQAGAGLAGGALFAPLLRHIATAQMRAVRRFVFVVEGNCSEPAAFLSPMARAGIDPLLSGPIGTARWWYNRYRDRPATVIDAPDLASAPALAALGGASSIVDKSTVIYGLSSHITGGGHSAFHGALSSTRTVGGRPSGITIDALLAKNAGVRGNTPLEALRLATGPLGQPVNYGLCANGPGQPAPMIVDPRAAFESLFSSVGTPEERVVFARRRRLLDFARADANAAMGLFASSSPERAKVEAYLAAIEDATRRHERFVAMEPALTRVRPAPPASNPLFMGSDPLDAFRAHMQLATAALLGDLSRVVVVGHGPGGQWSFTYPSILPGINRHDTHHGSGANPMYVTAIHRTTGALIEAIATMARTLASTPDPAGGTMLDSTMIVHVGDNGEQHHSTASEFPALVVGGQGLGLAPGGKTIAYAGLGTPRHRQLSNLWNTVGHAAGIELDTFGDERHFRVAPGPLSELRP